MELAIWQAEQQTKLDLADGVVTVGGAAADGVRIAGLPPSVLRLTVEGDRLTVQAAETVQVNGVLFPPGVPRLLMAGESVGLPEEVLIQRPARFDRVEARENAGTAQVLRQLLFEAGEPTDTKAATLMCLTGLDAGRGFPLAGPELEIGRGAQVQVRVRDRSVSRRHARVLREGDDYLLEDLGSPNGVFVNGAQVTGRVALTDGAVVELGQSLLRFNGPALPAQPPPPPPPDAEDEAEAATPPPAHPTLWTRLCCAEWALIAAGATLAVTGVLVSWGLA